MDIHKPKPWHGVREFLKEYAIIVVGVLTALAAEQVAEALHRNVEVREAREALREEIKLNARAADYSREEAKCIRAQLDAYAAWVEGGPRPAPMRSNLPRHDFTTWDAVKASAVPHMPLKERLALGNFYEGVRNAETMVDEQRAGMLVLFGLEERKQLTEQDRARVLDAVGAERRLGTFQSATSRGLLKRAGDLGVRLPPMPSEDREALDWVCARGGHDPYPIEG